MTSFKIISDLNEITANSKWTSATKFNSKNRLVDEEGYRVGSDHKGRQYQIIEKKERTFSALERFGRGLLGTIAAICTLSLGLFLKSVRNLFTQSKETIRFAVLVPNVNTESDEAINREDSDAINNLASMYEHGKENVVKDIKKAVNLYAYAAILGNIAAMRNLASIYARGEKGVQRDTDKAKKLLQEANRLEKERAAESDISRL